MGPQIHGSPLTEVAFTDDSPIAKEDANKKNGLTDSGKNVAVEFGLGAAVTLSDGALALGVNYLEFRRERFRTPWKRHQQDGQQDPQHVVLHGHFSP